MTTEHRTRVALIAAGLTATLATVAILSRYTLYSVASADGPATIYRLDRWTGHTDASAIMADQWLPVLEP